MASKDSALALPSASALMVPQEESTLQPHDQTPYVGFYSKKAEKALDIAQAIPGITEGEPYVFAKNLFTPVQALTLVGYVFRYFVVKDDSYKILKASLVEDRSNRDMKEEVLAVTLAFTERGLIPTLTTFRTTKAKVPQDLVNGQRMATDDLCNSKGPVGKILAQLPVPLRVCGTVDVFTKTSAAGRSYVTCRARASLLDDKQVETLVTAMKDGEFNEAVNAVVEAYNARKGIIESHLG